MAGAAEAQNPKIVDNLLDKPFVGRKIAARNVVAGPFTQACIPNDGITVRFAI
jgi:hypothetical protein